MEPAAGGRTPAPPPLDVVQAFVNTADLEAATDRLGRPGDLVAFLARHGLSTARRATRGELAGALALREAIRRLLRDGSEALGAADRRVLETAWRRADLRPAPHGDALALEPPGDGVDAALGRLLAVLHRAGADGTLARLKVCREDTCQWAFYDRSRNHAGQWCSMRLCGTRAKMRDYRARKAAAR